MKFTPKPKIETSSRVRACSGELQSTSKTSTPPDNQGTLNNSQKLSELLEACGARGKALKALLDGLTATRLVYCPKTKQLVEEPDHRIRTSSAVDTLCFTDGKPVERREQVNINLDGKDVEAQKKFIDSPALRASLKQKIEEAEAQREKADKVIEIETTKGRTE